MKPPDALQSAAALGTHCSAYLTDRNLPNVAVSGRWTRELARVDDGPLHPLDGRREASAPSLSISRGT